MGKKYHLKRLDGLDALEKRVFYMREKFPTLENIAVKYFCFASIYNYQKISKNFHLDDNFIYRKNIYARVKVFYKIDFYGEWNIKEKFWFLYFVISPKLCSYTRNIFKIGV